MNMTRCFGGLRMHRVVVSPAERTRVQLQAQARKAAEVEESDDERSA